MTDEMLHALAKNGGVVHINFFEGFLDHGFMERFDALKDEQAQQDSIERLGPKFGDRSGLGPAVRRINTQRIAKLGRVPMSRLLDHIDHAVMVAGVDHVGLGSDFDGADDQFPEGVEDVSKIPNVVRGLMERGYSDESILKILGGNTLRVMRAVERGSQVGLRNGFTRPAAVLRSPDN
jgi:membrane dipeptidase